MKITQFYGESFNSSSESVVGGSATVTQAATTGRTYYITDLSASAGEATAVISVTSAATKYWQDRVNGSVTVAYHKEFVSPIRVSTGSAVTVRLVVGSTAGINGSSFVNVSGYFT